MKLKSRRTGINSSSRSQKETDQDSSWITGDPPTRQNYFGEKKFLIALRMPADSVSRRCWRSRFHRLSQIWRRCSGNCSAQNVELNRVSKFSHSCVTADVFKYLREHELNYDLVILDPPAFAKKQKDIVQACRGYKDINRLAMLKMPAQSYLLTSSCSYYVNEELFRKVIFQASVEAKRKARIVEHHRQAADHPVNLCHPESEYLKSFLLYIE